MDSILIILHQKRSRPRRVGRVLRQKGFALDIRRPCQGDPLPTTMDEHAAVVIFGGPMGVYECEEHPFLRVELDWISLALESGKPFLGICLGCQMLAHALGGKVWRHPKGLHEVGYFRFSQRPRETLRLVATSLCRYAMNSGMLPFTSVTVVW